MKKIIALPAVALLSSGVLANEPVQSEHAKKTLEIYTHIVAVESSRNLGQVPDIVNYRVAELAAKA